MLLVSRDGEAPSQQLPSSFLQVTWVWKVVIAFFEANKSPAVRDKFIVDTAKGVIAAPGPCRKEEEEVYHAVEETPQRCC